MSFMFETYVKPPVSPAKKAAITEQVLALGGRLDYHEDEGENAKNGVTLTYDFEDLSVAAKAANVVRQLGEHVEGPVDYGP